MRALPWVLLLSAGIACKDKHGDDVDTDREGTAAWLSARGALGPVTAVARRGDGSWIAASGEALWSASDGAEASPEPLSRDGLSDGPITRLFAHGDVLHAVVHERGLFTADASSAPLSWQRADDGLASPILAFLNETARPKPVMVRKDEAGRWWMAGGGGVFRSDDGKTWRDAGTSSSGATNVVFADVAASGDRVVAVSVLPDSIIPKAYAGVLSGRVFLSEDGGGAWSEIGGDLPSSSPVAVALEGEAIHVGTLDQGVFTWTGGTWQAIDGGPSDVIGLDVAADGSLLVGSATRGAWQHDGEVWHQVGEGPVRAVLDDAVVGLDGTVFAPDDGASRAEPPAEGGGTVYVALSFHGNYYHSYRGDSPTDDGFGLDIDVIRNTLDWLEARPWVHADWDFDNHWSTDLWMPEHSPDILADIKARVAAGTDDVRLMSYNNGAMSAMTLEEFTAGVERAKASNQAAFGAWVPGVQPQENMITPDHLTWYPQLGIDWITLFYAANGFTGPRLDIELPPLAQHNPVTLTDADGVGAMTWVPVYHHADVLEHGGLLGWVRQLHALHAEDTLLAIHFDADAETWEPFAAELDAIADLDFVQSTTIGDYLADHEPVATAILPGDCADGTGDGYQSWAEKDLNHRVFTRVIEGRHLAAAAEVVDGLDSDADDGVQEALDASFDARLLALSTTNYGLSAPFLHPDRVASAMAQTGEAIDEASQALDLVLSPDGVPVGQVRLVNPRGVAGPAWFSFEQSHAEILGPEEFVVTAGGDPVAVDVDVVQGTPDVATLSGFVDVPASGVVTLEVAFHAGSDASTPQASSSAPNVPGWLGAPFTACGEGEITATFDGLSTRVGGASASTIETWRLPTCAGSTTVTRTLSSYDALPGLLVVHVHAVMADTGSDALESVVLSPILCEDRADTLTWPTVGGAVYTRPVRHPVETWNGQQADGWAEVMCGGERYVVGHRMTERTSLGFLPLRSQGGRTLLAPLGALWGASPFHDGRATGGHGLGDLVVPIVGAQFSPPAPDWSGQTIDYTLVAQVGAGAPDRATLELFAYPPVSVVGEQEAP